MTTLISNIPSGSKTEISEDGSISTALKLGNADVVAKINPRGLLKAELTMTDSDGQSLFTSLDAPEGTQTTVNGNSLLNVVIPEDFTESQIQKSVLELGDNGVLNTSTPVLDEEGTVVATTTLEIPAGSLTSIGYTGAIWSKFPEEADANGDNLIPSLTQNSDGEIEMKLQRIGKGDGGSTQFLPKMPAGSSFRILRQSNGSRQFFGTMRLPPNGSVERQNRSLSDIIADESSSYLGRDPLTNAAIYVMALSDNTSMELEKAFTENTFTTIRMTEGTALLMTGSSERILQVGDELQVNNAAQEFNLKAGSNLFSFPIATAISAADLEIRLREAHSQWAWSVDNQSWQGFSSDLEKAYKLVNGLGIARLSKTTLSGQGIFVYTKDNLTINLPDEPPGEFRDTSVDRLSVWRLVGNNTDQPLTIPEILTKLPENIIAMWRLVGDDWRFYSIDTELLQWAQEEGVSDWSINEMLPVGGAIWVMVKPPGKILENLRRPPFP